VLLNVQYAADLFEVQQHLLACGCDFMHFTLLNQIALIGQPFQINSCILKIEVYLIDYPGLTRSFSTAYFQNAAQYLQPGSPCHLFPSKKISYYSWI
jgi:hypothetical protein